MHPLRLVAAWLIALALPAVEVPAKVTSVTDGDTIRVEVDGTVRKVRLLWINTPESRDGVQGPAQPEGAVATRALRDLLPKGTVVRLWGPGETLDEDTYGRWLALVLVGRTGEDSAQEHQIRLGWSPLWERHSRPPEPWRSRFEKAEAEARAANAGAWATQPDVMEKRARVQPRSDQRR